MTRDVLNKVLELLDKVLQTAPSMDAAHIDRYLAEKLGEAQMLTSDTSPSKFIQAAIKDIRAAVYAYPINSHERAQAFARMRIDFHNICVFLANQDVGKDRDNVELIKHAAAVTKEAVVLIDTTHSDSFRDSLLPWAVMMAL